MTYFGVLKTGASCIPVDPESKVNEILNFAGAGDAAGLVISEKLDEEHPELRQRLTDEGLTLRVWTFSEVFALSDEETEDERIALLPQKVQAQSVASLIFTPARQDVPKSDALIATSRAWSRCCLLSSTCRPKTGAIGSPVASHF